MIAAPTELASIRAGLARRRRMKSFFFGIALLFCGFFANGVLPVGLCFSNPTLNVVFLFSGFLLPVVLAIVSWQAFAGTARMIMLVGSIFLMALSGIGLILTLGFVGMRDRQYETPVPPYIIAVFRTNGGATTSYGVEVRQEFPVLPGIRAVRTLVNCSHGMSCAVTAPNPGSIHLVVDPTSTPKTIDCELKPLHEIFAGSVQHR